MAPPKGVGLAPDALGPTITVGEILVEVMATSRGEGFREPMDLRGPFPSGAPAIFVDQCARMGGSAGIVAAVGDDDFGRMALARLAGDGVDVSAVAVRAGHPTGTAFVRYRPDGSRDFVYNIARSAAALVRLDAPVRDLIARAGHLHVMGTAMSVPALWPVLDHALGTVRARGGSVSLDPNLRKELADAEAWDRLQTLAGKADLVLPSGDELALVAGTGDEGAAVATLIDRGVGEVVLKRGAAGATWFGPGGARLDQPAFPVREVDPTGAGDCFGGAFVAARRLGLDPATSLRYAAAAGARNVATLGPMEGAGTRAGLDAFIAAGPQALQNIS